MSISPGMIGFVGSKKPVFIQKAIMFFTKSKWSHCFFITFSVGGEEAVQEASYSEQIIPFQRYRDDPDNYYELYKLIVADPVKLEQSVRRCFRELTGIRYNFLGLIWFMWRWMNELVGNDIRHQKNFVTDGLICSQSNYYMIEYTGGSYSGLLRDETPWTIQPEDIYGVVKSRLDLFKLVEKKS